MDFFFVYGRDWDRLQKLLPRIRTPFRKAKRKGGRPRLPDQICFNALIYVLLGGSWRTLPKELGSPTTVLRRLHEWRRLRLLGGLWRAFLGSMHQIRLNRLRWRLRYRPTLPEWQRNLIVIYETEFSEGAELHKEFRRLYGEKGLRPEDYLEDAVLRLRFANKRLRNPPSES